MGHYIQQRTVAEDLIDSLQKNHLIFRARLLLDREQARPNANIPCLQTVPTSGTKRSPICVANGKPTERRKRPQFLSGLATKVRPRCLPLRTVFPKSVQVHELAMGQKPVPPVNIPIPTKIGSKMGGEFTYPTFWDPKTVLTTANSGSQQPFRLSHQSGWAPPWQHSAPPRARPSWWPRPQTPGAGASGSLLLLRAETDAID